MNSQANSRRSVFISYSHQDKSWLERLRVHLKPLERDLKIDIWDDSEIAPGSRWRDEIKAELNSARVAILLISADFLASDFISNNELPSLLLAAEKDGARILPVIVSPCRYSHHQELSQLQAVNSGSRALIKLEKYEQEEILVQVAELIEECFYPRKSEPEFHPEEIKNREPRRETTKFDSSIPPQTAQLPQGFLGPLIVAHNVPLGPQMLGMSIMSAGQIRSSTGQTGQIVYSFFDMMGRQLFANPNEFRYRNPAGQVTTGTDPFPISLDPIDISGRPAFIPYYALNFQPSNGMLRHDLSVTGYLLVGGNTVAQSPMTPFFLMW